ncbi:MAG: pilus assembly protein N-terminal domain-containing protein [Defluviicoccus sp.]|nr:pilus assembly protein N-terminal domain-containing protein [Defluviicoccus sp.]
MPIRRTAALAVCGAILCACAGGPLSEGGGGATLLRDNLAVAEAALAAGQPAAARRLYSSLAERFDEAPEPLLGLGYISFDAKEFPAAERFFVQAGERSDDASAIRGESLLGAARSALAAGRIDDARAHFRDAREAGVDLPSAAWAANGLAVIATAGGDFDAAETRYAEALRLSSGDPRITANFLRMLIAAGMTDRAAEIDARHDPSFWRDGDGPALSRLIDESRRRGLAGARAGNPLSALVLRLSPTGEDAIRVERYDPPASSGLLMRLGEAPARAAAPVAEDAPVKPARAERLPPASEPGQPAARPSGRKAPNVLTLTLGHSRRLRLTGEATGVLVAAPDIADVQLLSPKALYIIGKRVGRTTVAVLGEDERVRDWVLSVVLDIEPLRDILAREPELSGVQARRAARGIALTGEVASAALSERALRLAAGALPKDTPVENELRVTGSQQVNLEVQIAEVQRSVSEDIGINWEAFRIRGEDLLGFRIGRLLPGDGAVSRGVRATIDGEVSPGLYFGRATGTTRVAGMIDALARAGLANVLARPNVTAVSGEGASFFSGGEYPLPTGFEDGVIVFEYKKYGILLDFVPTVIDTGRIVLKVRPEVSEPSLNQAVQVVGVNVPVINVRRAETTVEVGDGESIVIAGLFRNASNTREAGVPGLKDIPGLGALFGQRSIRSEELELIVIVTARLVSPGSSTAEGQAPSPPRFSGYHF